MRLHIVKMFYRLTSVKFFLSTLLVILGLKSVWSSTVLFSCSFTRNTCGMVNQATATWRREYLSVGGRNGYAMILKGNEARNHFARLLTPEISAQGSETGCLQFKYFIEGRKPASLAVIKQGFVTEYIFGTARRTGDHWETGNVQVQFLGDKAKFYFEADTRVQEYGTSIVAFSDMILETNPCHQKQYPR